MKHLSDPDKDSRPLSISTMDNIILVVENLREMEMIEPGSGYKMLDTMELPGNLKAGLKATLDNPTAEVKITATYGNTNNTIQ